MMFAKDRFLKICFVFFSLFLGTITLKASELKYEYNEKGLITKIGDEYIESNDKRNEYRERAYMEFNHTVVTKDTQTDYKVHLPTLTPNHFGDLKKLFGNEEIMKLYEVGYVRTEEKNKEDYKSYVERRGKAWVERNNKGELSWWSCYGTTDEKTSFIGAVGCAYFSKESKENPNCVELAYLFTLEFQGQGFAEAILNPVIKCIWKEKPDSKGICAPVHPDNEKSLNLLKRLGFKHIQLKDYFSDFYKQPREYHFLVNPKNNYFE